MVTYSFQKLTVWQDARKLVRDVYRETESFPKSEQFGLTNQIRRAAISISSNLAEGCSRSSFKEQARFSEVSLGSLMEAFNQLILAQDLNYLSHETLDSLTIQIEKISNKLIALIKSQNERAEQKINKP